MKGRRRARRLALQALYELDQSAHGYGDVLIGRCQAILSEWFDRAGAELGSGLRARLIDSLTASLTDPSPGLIERLDDPRDRRAYVDDVVARLAGEGAHQAEHASLVRRIDGLADVIGQLAYAVRIVAGVRSAAPAIDAVIARIAPEWPVENMAPIDRNVLRIAIWEIGARSSPERVAINEAVELAREFSGESARRMVNGALGAYTSEPGRMLAIESGPTVGDERERPK